LGFDTVEPNATRGQPNSWTTLALIHEMAGGNATLPFFRYMSSSVRPSVFCLSVTFVRPT